MSDRSSVVKQGEQLFQNFNHRSDQKDILQLIKLIMYTVGLTVTVITDELARSKKLACTQN